MSGPSTPNAPNSWLARAWARIRRRPAFTRTRLEDALQRPTLAAVVHGYAKQLQRQAKAAGAMAHSTKAKRRKLPA